MRDGRGTLGTCLANVKRSGGDLDKLLCGLKKRSQQRSSCPAAPSRRDQPAVGADGKSQAEAGSSEVKTGPSSADLLLCSGNKVHRYLTESVGRNAALAIALREDEGLPSAPAEELLHGVSGGIREALRRDWLETGPRATDSQGQCPGGEPWVSGWPGHPNPWDIRFFKCEPPNAFPDKSGAELELSCLHSELLWVPGDLPEILPKDETRCVFLDLLKPMFSEHTIGHKKIVSSIKSTSSGPQIMLGSLALQPFKLANLSCPS